MKLVARLALGLVLIGGPALAGDGPAIKLSMNQVAGIAAALRELDGYTKPAKDGPAERVAYQLGGGVRLVIARDEAKLDEAITTWRTARQALLFETPGADKPGSDAAKKLDAETLKTAEVRMPYDLIKIKTDDLKLDVNPVPASVLAGLMPILD